ncbi:MAG TPA: PilT/PilU family type 4a pilus ATPase [Burkholderiales bacterium]
MQLNQLFKLMAEKQASDAFFSKAAPIHIKIHGSAVPLNSPPLGSEIIKKLAYEMMTEAQIREFESSMEMNFAHAIPGLGNFRINLFRQRGDIAMVVRYVKENIPPIDELGLPVFLKDLIMEKRGFVLVVGATGSGKSSTLASMLDYRNANKTGHILTVEEPIEYIFKHNKSIVNQREVGTDTKSFSNALVNAMREAPDVLMIGEIRDKETLQHALIYAQTGHLCLSTLHASTTYHALNRIVNFFPHEARASLLLDLSISLRCVLSQRLVKGSDGRLLPAVEVLLNTARIAELIKKGDFDQIREAMEQSIYPGSQSFEQALFQLFKSGKISKDEALANTDSYTNMLWMINNAAQVKEQPALTLSDTTLVDTDKKENEEFTLSLEMLNKLKN